jgi:hypothetical protein
MINMSNIIEFKGTPTFEVYNNGDFKIYAIRPDYDCDLALNKYGNVSIKGSYQDLILFNTYHIKAIEEHDEQYGASYNIQNIYMVKPESDSDIENFLNNILTDMQTETIMKSYPNIIDLVLDDKVDEIDIRQLYNIGKYRFNIIIEKIQENFKYMELTIKLFEYNLAHSDIIKLQNKYSNVDKILSAMDNNPYKVLCNIQGVSFKHADSKILKVKPELKNSKIRLIEVIKYIITDINNNGDSIITENALIDKLDSLDYGLVKLWNEYKENIGNEIIINENGITSRDMYDKELYIYNKLISANEDNDTWDININDYRDEDIKLTSEQLDALQNIADNNFSILVGVAGSGKTFCTHTIIKYLDNINKTYSIATPTGVASDIISQKTGKPASTIHRLLQYHPSFGFRLPIVESDVVIIDEGSMVDISLMYELLSKIDFKKTKLLLIADPAQIPSVGAGNILYDLLQMNTFIVTELTKVFRYAEGGLSKIAIETYNGKKWLPENEVEIQVYGNNKDYVLYPFDNDDGLYNLLQVYSYMIDKHPIDDIIVAMAYRVGDYGSNKINKMLKNLYNPPSPEKEQLSTKYKSFRIGDRVMQIENNYDAYKIDYDSIDFGWLLEDDFKNKFNDAKIFNGKIGTVVRIFKDYLIVKYPNKTIVYNSKSDFGQIELGYSLSIHKLQGSEYKNVILFTPSSHSYLLNRNLLYTGMTRASKRLIHIGNPKTICDSIEISEQHDRLTNLKFIGR